MVIDMSKETTKYRSCLEASSLSSIVNKGPTMLPSISLLLLAYRSRKLSISADLNEACYSMGLFAPSTNKLCFLFRDHRIATDSVKVMKMLVVCMGVADSTFLLNMCIKDITQRIKHTHPVISKTLSEFVYCDDIIFGVDSTEDAITIIKRIDQIVKDSEFRYHKFFSDGEKTLNSIIEDIR